MRAKNKGLTLIELLIVIAIMVLLFLILLLLLRKQLGRSRDAQRKADLERIKVAFEDYHNDNACYPEPEVLEDCGSDNFAPYLNAIPCDPMSGEPYLYQPVVDNPCTGYRVYAILEDVNDPIISTVGCSSGCGGANYNYGVAAGVAVATPGSGSGGGGGSETSPSPSGIIYVYACDAAGTCNQYELGHPFLVNCPVTFYDINCEFDCADEANRCEG